MFKQTEIRRQFSTQQREHHLPFNAQDSSVKLVERKRSTTRNEQWIFL